MFYAAVFTLLLALAFAQVCPTTDEITIDFEQDARGNPLAPGAIVTDQFSLLPIGVTITGASADTPSQPAMIFDTANPTPGDEDLGTPNEAVGGPGIGDGGTLTNLVALGNVLIISEDGNSAAPDDAASGGTIEFNFTHPITLLSMDVLDIDKETLKIQTFNADGEKLSSTNAIDPGDNSFQRVDINQDNVTRALVTASSSFGISSLSYICDECPEDCNKLKPGYCGCGIMDIDSDGDGMPDCVDLCPEDPNKIEPGTCGCGVEDMGANSTCECGNQICDCINFCGQLCFCQPNEICIDITLDCAIELILDIGIFTIDPVPVNGPNKRAAGQKTTVVVDKQGDEFSLKFDENTVAINQYKAVESGKVKSEQKSKVSSLTGSSNAGVTVIVNALLLVVSILLAF